MTENWLERLISEFRGNAKRNRKRSSAACLSLGYGRWRVGFELLEMRALLATITTPYTFHSGPVEQLSDARTSTFLGTNININNSGTTLVVGGTIASDDIQFHPGEGANRIKVKLNSYEYGAFAGVTSIKVYGQSGDDKIKVDGKINVPTLLDGGAGDDKLDSGDGPTTILGGPGNDKLKGGKGDDFIDGGDGNDTIEGGDGNDVLLGGLGSDTVHGENGRDVLIGGLGIDQLRGGKDDDLLIGGTTHYDADRVALNAIMAEWTRSDKTNYATRIGHLRDGSAGRLNGGYRLNTTTVLNDAAIDQLWGEGDDDWFFALTSDLNSDKIRDRRLGEVIT